MPSENVEVRLQELGVGLLELHPDGERIDHRGDLHAAQVPLGERPQGAEVRHGVEVVLDHLGGERGAVR